MGTGLQQIPFRIPEKWSAAWYQQHLRDVLALADSRNSIGVGLTVTGDPNTLATYSVDEDIRNLVNETFVLVSLSALTPNARQISADEGVSISDNGPGALLTIGLEDHGIPYDKLAELTTFGVLGRAPHIPGGPEEIAASTDGDVLCVQSDALGFTNVPIWSGIHNWIDGIATTWGTDGDLSIVHSGAAGTITNSTGNLAVVSAGGFTVNGDTLAEIAQDAVGTILVDSTSIDFTYNDGVPSITASTINANPTATIGLTAVNGTAATPMRSDGAPALSQTISPTWTGTHQFRGTPVRGGTASQISPGVVSDYAIFDLTTATAGTDKKTTEFFVEAGTGDFVISALNEAVTASREFFRAIRGTGIATSIINLGNSVDSTRIRLPGDNQELQLGASQDLRLYHDGTNSVIENDTGNLVLKVNGELDLEEVTTSTGANVPTIGTNKPGSAVALTPATWLTLIVNGVTYYTPLWT